MTSRKLVRKTLEFDSPIRIPRQMWVLPWAIEHYPEKVFSIQSNFPDDIVTSPAFYRKLPVTTGDKYQKGIYIDEWGCIFENRQKGIIGEIKEPLLKEWSDVETIKLPEERLSVDVDMVNAFCRNTDKFVLSGCCPRPFERLQFIRKTENLLIDLIEQPEELFILINRVHQFYIKELELWAKTEVDALTFMDDWGTQTSLLISPELWQKIFKPLYKDYIDIAHKYNKYIFMHSDGYIMDIISDLIELGLDALNAQIFCMNIEEIGRRFNGKITFWGEIDRQYILSRGTPEEVIGAVKRVYQSLYKDGGIIAQCEFGAGAKPENVYLVFKTWNDINSGNP
ncbi:methyltransferase [candidate division KSB1 bacterium]|nr:MAG: methyltransferase [candidate division KSB1 bacterium]